MEAKSRRVFYTDGTGGLEDALRDAYGPITPKEKEEAPIVDCLSIGEEHDPSPLAENPYFALCLKCGLYLEWHDDGEGPPPGLKDTIPVVVETSPSVQVEEGMTTDDVLAAISDRVETVVADQNVSDPDPGVPVPEAVEAPASEAVEQVTEEQAPTVPKRRGPGKKTIAKQRADARNAQRRAARAAKKAGESGQ